MDVLMILATTVGLVLLPILALHLVRDRRSVGLAVLASLVAALGLQLLFDRPRPAGVLLLLPQPGTPSFPSGHAVIAAALAILVARLAQRGRVAFGCLAGLVAVSRVAVGHHHPSDVAVGLLLGAGLGATIAGLKSGRGPAAWIWTHGALVAVITAAAWLRLLPDWLGGLPHLDKVLHFCLMGGLSFWLALWFGDRRVVGLPVAILLPLLVVLPEELLQTLSTARTADWGDVCADLAGMVGSWRVAVAARGWMS